MNMNANMNATPEKKSHIEKFSISMNEPASSKKYTHSGSISNSSSCGGDSSYSASCASIRTGTRSNEELELNLNLSRKNHHQDANHDNHSVDDGFVEYDNDEDESHRNSDNISNRNHKVSNDCRAEQLKKDEELAKELSNDLNSFNNDFGSEKKSRVPLIETYFNSKVGASASKNGDNGRESQRN